jgi:hypothetical protein
MNGIDAYKMYHAVKLHFTTPKYNFFTYQGKTNISEESFSNRKDKYCFHKLARKYNENDLVGFLVSNFTRDGAVWIRDLLTEEADSAFRNWKKVTQSMTETFKMDVDRLLPDTKDPVTFNQLFVVQEGQSPKLLQSYQQKDITLETVVILNSVIGFVEKWDKEISDDIVYPKISLRIRKYGAFLNVDVKKYKKILREMF